MSAQSFFFWGGGKGTTLSGKICQTLIECLPKSDYNDCLRDDDQDVGRGMFLHLPLNLSPHLAESKNPIVTSIARS